MKKIVCTGTSGSGKTTLANFISQEFNIPFLSGSAGDLKTEEDYRHLAEVFDWDKHKGGHYQVIQYSAANVRFGVLNQEMNQQRRAELIHNHDNFVTDRSPVDNLTYFIAQVGFHPEVTDNYIRMFAEKCYKSWCELTHLIYIKPVQPEGVEDNGSRVANKWWQRAIDAQFEYWLFEYFMAESNRLDDEGPLILVIDYWNLVQRKETVRNFLRD